MATNKTANSKPDVDELAVTRSKYDAALAHLRYVEQWARVHDFGMRQKTIVVLKQLGEWASE